MTRLRSGSQDPTVGAPPAGAPLGDSTGDDGERPVAPPPRRRQARGKRRIEDLLDAASAEFADRGYEAATTNSIAARAGVSPGTLYQFFANKESMADGLADRYLTELPAAYDEAFSPGHDGEALEAMVDRVVDAMVHYNLSDRCFATLFNGPDAPQRLAPAHERIRAAVLNRTIRLVASLAPDLARADQRRIAQVSVLIFRGVLPTILALSARERQAVIAELKRALNAYLTAALASSS